MSDTLDDARFSEKELLLLVLVSIAVMMSLSAFVLVVNG
jgi:hypothetical protein